MNEKDLKMRHCGIEAQQGQGERKCHLLELWSKGPLLERMSPRFFSSSRFTFFYELITLYRKFQAFAYISSYKNESKLA